LLDESLEWKREVEIYETQVRRGDPLDSFIQYYSLWYRLLKGIARLVRFLHFVQDTCGMKGSRQVNPSSESSNPVKQCRIIGPGEQPLTVEELQTAKIRLIRNVQRVEFPNEVACLKLKPKSSHGNRPIVNKSSRLSTLSPFVAEYGLVRVGGRLNRAKISFDAKHPVVIPSKHHLVDLLIRHYHKKEGHSRVRSVLTAIQREYWIL
jgi:hypothetical protein